MNISCLGKIKVGDFITYAELLADDLPALFSWERDRLRELCAAAATRLNSDRRNHILRELMDKDVPYLWITVKSLSGTLSALRKRGGISQGDENLLAEIKSRFSDHRKPYKMIHDALVVARFDAPSDPYCASIFAVLKDLAEELDAKLLRCAAEDARIKTIGGSLSLRDEAMKVIRRIKERAVGMSLETDDAERRQSGEKVLKSLGTITGMAKRHKQNKRKKAKEGDNGVQIPQVASQSTPQVATQVAPHVASQNTPHVATLHTGLTREPPRCGGMLCARAGMCSPNGAT